MQLMEHVGSRSGHSGIQPQPQAVSPDSRGLLPKTPVPPDEAAWEERCKRFQHDLQEMIKLVKNRKRFVAAIPHGDGQTILARRSCCRSQRLSPGQLIDLRRALAPAGILTPPSGNGGDS